MDPITMMLLGTGVSALSSLPQWLTGNTQGNRADEMEKSLGDRPQMQLAKGYSDALASAEEQAKMTRLPGQGAIEGRLDQTTANTVSSLERMGLGGADMINGASRAYGNQLSAETDLGVKAAGMRLNNQQLLRNQENIVGDQENQIWKTNELDPYMQKSAAIAALKESSIKNENSGLMNLFGSIGNGLMGAGVLGSRQGNWWDKFTGGGSGAGNFKSSAGATDSQEKNIFDLMSYGGMTLPA